MNLLFFPSCSLLGGERECERKEYKHKHIGLAGGKTKKKFLRDILPFSSHHNSSSRRHITSPGKGGEHQHTEKNTLHFSSPLRSSSPQIYISSFPYHIQHLVSSSFGSSVSSAGGPLPPDVAAVVLALHALVVPDHPGHLGRGGAGLARTVVGEAGALEVDPQLGPGVDGGDLVGSL